VCRITEHSDGAGLAEGGLVAAAWGGGPFPVYAETAQGEITGLIIDLAKEEELNSADPDSDRWWEQLLFLGSLAVDSGQLFVVDAGVVGVGDTDGRICSLFGDDRSAGSYVGDTERLYLSELLEPGGEIECVVGNVLEDI
jgi:hypothetical protein